MDPSFTILVPVVRTPELLELAMASVFAQSRQDFEVFIICDGAPEATQDYASTLARQDPRVTPFIREKGDQKGEVHRNEAMAHARGNYVCHIADDDLWLPNNLEEVARLLSNHDFGHTLRMDIDSLESGRVSLFDLSVAADHRQVMETPRNFFGLSNGVYRRSAYDRLESGWALAPSGISSDQYLWRRLLNLPGIRFATRHCVTTMILATPNRSGNSIEDRRKEMEYFLDLMRDEIALDLFVQRAYSRGTAVYAKHKEESWRSNPDVADAQLYAALLSFDPKRYLFLNPDLAAAEVNPYQHFLEHGLHERRRF